MALPWNIWLVEISSFADANRNAAPYSERQLSPALITPRLRREERLEVLLAGTRVVKGLRGRET
jgi:hypothetical protein